VIQSAGETTSKAIFDAVKKIDVLLTRLEVQLDALAEKNSD
jgi:hypothetical protein